MAQRLAAHHKDCLCFADTRYQLAVAYQEAKDYWASHPDDVENGPSEIHRQIEEMLVEEHILNPLPEHQPPEAERAEATEQPVEASSPAHKKRLAAKFLPSLHIKRHTFPLPSTAPAASVVSTASSTTATTSTSTASSSSSPLSSSPLASSTTTQHVWPMKRHTAPGNIHQAQVQERTSQVVSVGRLVHMVKTVALLKRTARASDPRNTESRETFSSGSVLSSQSTSTPSGSGSVDDSPSRKGKGRQEEQEDESDASSYHSLEMYGNWSFDELDADDRSLLDALKEEDEEEAHHYDGDQNQDRVPSVLSTSPETVSSHQAHVHRSERSATRTPESMPDDTFAFSAPSTSVQCYSARVQYDYEPSSYAQLVSGRRESSASGSHRRHRPRPHRRYAYSLESDVGSEALEMESEKEMDRLDWAPRQPEWGRGSDSENDTESPMHDLERRRYFRNHPRNGSLLRVDSRTKMAMLIQRQRAQEHGSAVSSIIDKTYFDPTDCSSSDYGSSVFADTDADTEPVHPRARHPQSSPTISSVSFISKYSSLSRSLMSPHSQKWVSKTTVNCGLLVWAILMNLVTFYIYWHTEHS